MSRRLPTLHGAPTAERVKLFTKSDDATGCIEWQGSVTRGGYAQVTDNGRRVYLHRWTWEQANGPVPDGLFLDHLCRNPRCCNPDHLEPVTFRENVLRGTGVSARNAVKTHCPYGHEYTPDNTYVNPRGSRVCRTCKVARGAEYRARKTARRSAA